MLPLTSAPLDRKSKGFNFQKSGIGFVKIENVNNGIIDKRTIEAYISEEAHLAQSRSILQKDDLLFSIAGTIGKIALVKESDLPLNTNQALAIIRGYTDKMTPDFLGYTLVSSILNETLNKARGGALQNISLADLKNAEIIYPSSKIEQRRITSKLDELFLKIDKSILLLEENLKHSKALMGSILDEVFTNLENTSEVVKISKIADIKGGKRLPKGEQLQNTKTDYPYIRVTDFNDNGSIDVNDLKYMTKEIQSKISRYIITSDDLYISIAGTIGKTGIIPKELDGANLTENAARFVYKDKKGISNKFVYYYTKSDKFKAFVSEATKQVAQPKLALARLNEIELALPSITEQEKAVAKFIEMEKALSKMEKEIQIKLYNMKALKNSLLDQAFKGEL